MLTNSQAKYIKVIEWSLFLGLCGLSAIFMWGVLDKFSSGKTSFTQVEEPIKELPTITLCLSMPDSREIEYEYGTDFEIKYEISAENSKHSIILNDGENSTILGEKVFMEKFITILFKNCYKIRSILSNGYVIKDSTIIQINFNTSMSEGDLPYSLQSYFTSENNAYGIVTSMWKNGKATRIHIDKGMAKDISLKAKKHRYLETYNKCSKESYYECLSRKIMAAKKCTSVSLPFLPICKDDKIDDNISAWKFHNHLKNVTKDCNNCLTKLCTTLEYSGEETYNEKLRVNNITVAFGYFFSSNSTTVYEEYLIYDVISAIGSVGGTLGMCIGFSFTGLISYIIHLIQYRIMIIRIKLTKQVFSKKGSIAAESYEERECMERFRRSDNFQDKQIFDEKLNETNAKLKEHQKLIEGISKQVESIKVKINMI